MHKREIRTEITIAATPQVIWSILTCLEKYSRWNPFILKSRGIPKVGEKLECRPRLPGEKRIHKFNPVVTKALPCRIFAWKGYVLFPGLADGEHIFELISEREGVLLVHRQDFEGLLIPFIWPFMARKTKKGFEMMNQALKMRAEAAMNTELL